MSNTNKTKNSFPPSPSKGPRWISNRGWRPFTALHPCCYFLSVLLPCLGVSPLSFCLFQCGSFSWTAALHKLLWYVSLRFQDMFCMDSSLWPAVPARSLLQQGFSTGCSFLLGTSTCPGSSSSCTWISAPLRTSTPCKGTAASPWTAEDWSSSSPPRYLQCFVS